MTKGTAHGRPHLFVMIPRVARGFLLLLLFSTFAGAAAMEDAVRDLAARISSRLAPEEAAHVTLHNLSSLSDVEAARVQAMIDRALRRDVRNGTPLEIVLTISENLKGYLLVAEIRRANERAVEMVPYHPDPARAPAPSALTMEKKLLWEQAAPILDLAVPADQMLVLDTTGVARYERRAGKWERADFVRASGTTARDPRGRLETNGDSLKVELPGETCRGTWAPALALQCEAGGIFSAGRNTIEMADSPPFFSHAQIGGEHVFAEPDGRIHVYDAERKPAGAFDDWGSDFAVISSTCTDAAGIVATAPAGRESTDSIALYHLVNRTPVRASDPVEFPGPVTALWPATNGALAVVRNLSTGRYEAYSLTLDCGR
jgi:hypothetical protein